MTTTYHLIAVFNGECCESGHLWFQSVRARTPKEAAAKLRRSVERSGSKNVSEICQVDSPNAQLIWDKF